MEKITQYKEAHYKRIYTLSENPLHLCEKILTELYEKHKKREIQKNLK